MFRRLPIPLGLPSTPSFQVSNLTAAYREVDNLLAYNHIDQANVVEFGENMNVPSGPSTLVEKVSPRCQVYDLKYIDICGTEYLGIATGDDFQLWDSAGSRLMWSHKLSDVISDLGIDVNPDTESVYVKGITSPYNRKGRAGRVCVGSSIGAISVLSEEGSVVSIIPSESSSVSSVVAITALASSERFLVSADDQGCLYRYSCEDSFRRGGEGVRIRPTDPKQSEYCTSLVFSDETTLIGTFISGHIRVYKLSNCELFLDIAAHSRCITGLALDSTKSFFATCGEDGSINVWTTPKPPIGAGTPGQGEIDLLFNERGGSGIYTGIAWMQDGRLAVAAYDDPDLLFFVPINGP